MEMCQVIAAHGIWTVFPVARYTTQNLGNSTESRSN